MNNYYIWDIETFPNIFTFAGKFRGIDEVYLFEISDRMNQRDELLTHLSYLRNSGVEMVGFNNLGFDYPIIHDLMINPYLFTYERAKQLADQIISAQRFRGGINQIRFYERLIPQIDIYKMCHFDNDAKRTSLKALQFAMRSESLEDLPFALRDLTHEEKDVLRSYNVHDILETERFFNLVEHHLEMRREFLNDGVLQGDVLNYSDVKIGIEYLLTRIGKNKCFNGSKPKQTFRTQVDFKDIILPKINYKTDKYNAVLEWFKAQTYYSAPGSPRPSLTCKLAGLDFHFGIGGVHASASNKVFKSDEEYQIIDIDVSGMYPSIAIANRFAPEHLGEMFITAYSQIKSDRARYAKGTARNKAMKLAGNGAYGNFNNPFSPLYDPKCMCLITVNGQLQILQLVEMIELLPDCELIQANTDGITVRVKREIEPFFRFWCKVWENDTLLELEEVLYSRMWIRDVNNYISEKTDGKLKRKGVYEYPATLKDYDDLWHKDWSNIASKKIADKCMTLGWLPEMAAMLMTDKFDFMLRYKATGESKLFIGDVEQLKTVRYYVSVSGQPMKKVSPPRGEVGQYKRKSKITDEYFNSVMKEIGKGVWDERIHTKNKSKYDIVETSVQSGWKVKECNKASDFDWNDVDWRFYIEEAKKIIIGEGNV